MWLFELFKLFYIFCVSFLPVIVDTGVQVKIFILVWFHMRALQVWNGIEINATDFGRTEQWRCKQDCSGTDQSKVFIVSWFQRVSDVEDVDSNCIVKFSGSGQQKTSKEFTQN